MSKEQVTNIHGQFCYSAFMAYVFSHLLMKVNRSESSERMAATTTTIGFMVRKFRCRSFTQNCKRNERASERTNGWARINLGKLEHFWMIMFQDILGWFRIGHTCFSVHCLTMKILISGNEWGCGLSQDQGQAIGMEPCEGDWKLEIEKWRK